MINHQPKDVMATAKQAPALTATGHSVEFDYRQQLDNEQVYLTFETEWRGQPAVVRMQADRYRHSSGISEWRYRVDEARGADTSDGRRGADLSGTARSRLSDQLRPLVEEWLGSEAYETSRDEAYFDAVRRMVREARPYPDPMRDVRKVLLDSVYMTIAQRDRLYRMAEAYEAFTLAYNEAP